ncbi:MAG: hypothetical protein DCO81_05845 [Candidatus Aquiluna sp. XM-24bin5]|nr:MAG: hypothetical protein DCO81_05845 [Candidatus Aquiluna sp. XM-24bin5]
MPRNKKTAGAVLVLLLGGLLSGCTDPYSGAEIRLEVRGAKEISGETVDLVATVATLGSPARILFEERLDGGEWMEISTLAIAAGETVAQSTDRVDPASTVEYRAVLLSDTGQEPIVQSVAGPFAPKTLAEFVSENLSLELSVGETRDRSGYLFDGDEVTLRAEASGIENQNLSGELKLLLVTESETVELTSNSLDTFEFAWVVSSDTTTAELGELVLEAAVTTQSDSVTESTNEFVLIANPVAAFEALAEETNSLIGSIRRDAVQDAAGEIFLDAESPAWKASESIDFIFREPFLGNVSNYDSASIYQVPWSCAPGGQVDTADLPGRSFTIEVAVEDSEYDETIFGYFDGSRMYFSVAWRYCM